MDMKRLRAFINADELRFYKLYVYLSGDKAGKKNGPSF
jgi:hypothetical protein